MSTTKFLQIFDEHKKNKTMFNFTEFANELKQLKPDRTLNKTSLALNFN